MAASPCGHRNQTVCALVHRLFRNILFMTLCSTVPSSVHGLIHLRSRAKQGYDDWNTVFHAKREASF